MSDRQSGYRRSGYRRLDPSNCNHETFPREDLKGCCASLICPDCGAWVCKSCNGLEANWISGRCDSCYAKESREQAELQKQQTEEMYRQRERREILAKLSIERESLRMELIHRPMSVSERVELETKIVGFKLAIEMIHEREK